MRRSFGFIVSLLATDVAVAQPYQIQPGNVLDANPLYGSGGFNSGARRYQVNSANRIVTGNVGGGAGFRGFSPISDPSAFGLSNSGSMLPSDQLYNFRRDTFSVADVRTSMISPYARSPYYSQSSTVVNTGAIVAGLNQPGTSQLRSPHLSPRIDLRSRPESPLDLTAPGTLSVAPRVERLDTGQLVSGQLNQRLLASPLFGAVRAIPANELAADAARQASLGDNLALPLDPRLQPAAPIDQRTQAQAGRDGGAESPLGRVLSGQPDVQTSADPAPQTGRLQDDRLPFDARLPARPATPEGASPTSVGDTFTAMRQMTGGLVQPLRKAPTIAEADAADRAESARLLRPLQPAQPPLEGVQAQVPPQPGRVIVQPEPLRSFVGTERSALNRYLSQAEAALRSGQYYKAQGLYDIARSIDPDNPLPLLGRALALLAAGEYVSSADSLFRAIQLYEDLSQFPVDLAAFVPDVKMLDRRRADLEQRLQAGGDYRMRFLLGYAEYTSGLQALGLQNMKRAAQDAPPELEHLRRFVVALEARTAAARPAP